MTELDVSRFVERINVVFLLDHAGRAGNGFVLTLFDRHAEVLSCPLMHYTYSYIVTEFGEDEKLDAARVREFWARHYYFRLVYNDLDEEMADQVRRFGGDPEAPLDRARVRRVFDDFLRERRHVTRRELIAVTHLAYAMGMGRDVEAVRYLLLSDSISLRTENVMDGFSGRIVDVVVRDFPDAKLVHLVRDPRAGFASTRHQFINSLGNMYGIKPGNYWHRLGRLIRDDFDWDSVFVFGFWLMYFRRTFDAAEAATKRHSDRFRTLHNEDLNLDFARTIKDLCDWLGVALAPDWGRPDYAPTMLGLPWAGTGAYNNRYQTHRYGPLANDPDSVARKATGPNRQVTERWMTRLGRNEIYLIEKFLRGEFAAYGYPMREFAEKRGDGWAFQWALWRPLRGELPRPRWLWLGWRLGPAEGASRLFYVFAFPLFYVMARLAFLRVVRQGTVFGP